MDDEYLRWPVAESQEHQPAEFELVDALIPLPRTPLD